MSLDRETIRRMLESGARAPSGDNLQPWTMVVGEDSIHLSVDRSRDRSLYNFEGRASLIALGAMIENLTLAGREYGVGVDTTLVAEEPQVVSVRLALRPAAPRADPLFSATARRCTNRKPYATAPLEATVTERLRASVSADSGADLRLIEDRHDMRLVARAASLNDRLLFELRPLHDRFFESVRWTAQEAEATRDGLYVRTLELGPIAPGFKAMRSWPLVRAMNLVGASRLAPGHSYQTFMRSAAFGFLQMADLSPQAFVEGGRQFERLWLTATSLGISLQPMAGMLYLLVYLLSDQLSDQGVRLTRSHRSLVVRAEGLFKRVLPLDDRKAPIMLFRVGYGPPPSATSLRRRLETPPISPT
jgi:nitroreductase